MRIRYKKISENVYQTTKPVMLGQFLAHAVINVNTKHAQIYDGNHIIFETNAKDFNALKKAIRTAFKNNGAQLTDEVRKVIE